MTVILVKEMHPSKLENAPSLMGFSLLLRGIRAFLFPGSACG